MKRHTSAQNFLPTGHWRKALALMTGALTLLLTVAPHPLFGQEAPLSTEAPAAAPTDPTSALTQAFGEQFVYRCGKITSSQSDESTGPMRWIFRNDFRLYSDTINIKCDMLVYETQDGQTRLRATPAVGERVEIVHSGMRASCGLLEYYPDEKLTILRRRPVIYQKDESGREFETSGHVITMTQNAEGQLRITIDSKKSDVEGMVSPEPAILIVDSQTKSSPAQGLSLEEMRRRMESGGRLNLTTLDDMFGIPVQTRKESDHRQ